MLSETNGVLITLARSMVVARVLSISLLVTSLVCSAHDAQTLNRVRVRVNLVNDSNVRPDLCFQLHNEHQQHGDPGRGSSCKGSRSKTKETQACTEAGKTW